jgi:hypothetical protein
MAGQGEVLITMSVPASTPRGAIISGAGTLSATLRGVGVLVEGTDASETKASVQISGTALVLLGATLTAGAMFISDASGKAVAHTADTDAVDGDDDLVCGVLLEGGDSGELRTCIIK